MIQAAGRYIAAHATPRHVSRQRRRWMPRAIHAVPRTPLTFRRYADHYAKQYARYRDADIALSFRWRLRLALCAPFAVTMALRVIEC